jgi:adenylate kinase family enzyme
MRKIHITGNSGSGKTTLAARLGGALDMPVFGLDNVVYQIGWVKTPIEDRVNRENALAAQDSWIIEGVSPRLRAAADCIILLMSAT